MNEMQVFFLLAFGARCSLTVNWFATVTFGWVFGLVVVVFPVVSPRVDFWHFRKFCGTLTEIGPWSLGRTSGTITVSVCEHCYVHFDDNIWFGLVDYFEKMSVVLDFCSKLSCTCLFSFFWLLGCSVECCYVAEDLVTSQELKIKQ
jgi:hypothetical protein